MKATVITPAFNSAKTIEGTIASVAQQTYHDIEHIVVDGGSADGTLEKLETHRKNIKWISERDHGIYDAMNKGIGMATGEIIGFLNADDEYADAFVIERIVAAFLEHNPDCVYGDLVYVDASMLRVIRRWITGEISPSSFRWGRFPPHPTFYARRIIYERLGGYRLDFKVAADFELMYRFMAKHGCRSSYIPEVLVKMRAGGKSNGALRGILTGVLECNRTFSIHDNRANPLFVPSTLAFRLAQAVRAVF